MPALFHACKVTHYHLILKIKVNLHKIPYLLVKPCDIYILVTAYMFVLEEEHNLKHVYFSTKIMLFDLGHGNRRSI